MPVYATSHFSVQNADGTERYAFMVSTDLTIVHNGTDVVTLGPDALQALGRRVIEWAKLTEDERLFVGGLTAWIKHGMPTAAELREDVDLCNRQSAQHDAEAQATRVALDAIGEALAQPKVEHA